MSVLTHSRDIFISTNQSGRVGAGESQFSRFRMGLNTSPLTCGAGEMTKLSVTQFSCFRNFYYINQLNNLVAVSYTHNATDYDEFIQLTPGDYDDIEAIAIEFTIQLKALFLARGVNFIADAATQKPAGLESPRLRKYGVTMNANGHGVTNLKIQTRQYNVNAAGQGVPNLGGSPQFGDSYCILGSKRIGAEDANATSFAIVPTANSISIASRRTSRPTAASKIRIWSRVTSSPKSPWTTSCAPSSTRPAPTSSTRTTDTSPSCAST